MESRAKFLGHAVHPMLIAFPLGLLAAAVVFDVLYLFTDESDFWIAAAYSIAGGIIGGAAAALFGWIDWFAIPSGTRAKRVGLIHGLGNAVVLALFAVSWLIRNGEPGWEATGPAMALGFVGAAIALVTSWLGGELVERLGVAVDPEAHLDAPSSLRRGPTSGDTGTPNRRTRLATGKSAPR